MNQIENLEAVSKLTREIKNGAKTLGANEARYLVDTYYQLQEFRIRMQNQKRAVDQGVDEASDVMLDFFVNNFVTLEKDMKKVLKSYVEAQPIGTWLLSICGIGEVLAAGLIAHIDITKVQSAGQIQAFAGLDPTREWKKGQKRPFNAKLKTLCWKCGESFVKMKNRDSDVYGHLFDERKAYELDKNEKGDYAAEAEKALANKKIGKETEAYKWYSQGKLPPAHIHARAKRHAVKLFLSHLFEVWYELENGEKPARPYPIAILGHAHEIKCPNREVVGLD